MLMHDELEPLNSRSFLTLPQFIAGEPPEFTAPALTPPPSAAGIQLTHDRVLLSAQTLVPFLQATSDERITLSSV